MTFPDSFRQKLSLEKDYPLDIPASQDLATIAGPVTDLLTFYVDVSPIHSKDKLINIGDSVTYSNGVVGDWKKLLSDNFLVAEDCVDFKYTLIDKNKDTVKLKVDHFPPKKRCDAMNLPAERMRQPNESGIYYNWAQIIKNPTGNGVIYVVQLAVEKFTADITIDQRDGKILEATLYNPVDVKEIFCMDAQYLQCHPTDKPNYTILRQIKIKLR